MRPNHVLRAALPVAVAAAFTATAAPAAAAERGPGVLANARMYVLLVPDGVAFCVHGEMNPGQQVAGTWSLTVAGVRDGVPFTGSGWTSSARTVDHCETAPKDSSNAGYVSAQFAYTGAGSYLAAESVGGAVWNPAVGTQTYAVDLTP